MPDLLTLLAVLAMQPPAADAPAPITVHVTGVRDARGFVRVELCTARTFLHSGCEVTMSVPAVAGETVVTLPEIDPGAYALQVYHDRNGNREVDRGALGVPLEEVGFSRDAPVGLKGPSFPRAAFVHESTPQSVVVKLKRYF